MLGKAALLAKTGLIVVATLFIFWMVVPLFAGVPAEDRPPITPGPRPTISPHKGESSRGSIRGTVYEDWDGDGKCAGTGDPGLPGITLDLSSGGNSISVIFGDDGTYAPVSMGQGVWTVTVKPPDGWRAAPVNARTALLDNNQLLVLGVDFCLAEVAAMLPPAPPTYRLPARSYMIQRGDNLFRIGLRFGFTVNELAAYNTIANPNLIYAGQVILIPPG